MLGDDTLIVALQNGIPWWYFQRRGGPFEGRRLIPGTPQERLTRALQVGAVRPSMLQDVHAGHRSKSSHCSERSSNLADLVGTPNPSIAAVYSCARLLNSVIVDRQVRLVPQSIA